MKFDIAIIGGGIAGNTLACALQKSPFRIALIEASPSIEDHRLIALNHASCRLLKNIGIWELLSDHAASIKQVHISHRGHFGAARIHAHEIGLDRLGHVIPAKHINTALLDSVNNMPNVTRLCPASLTSLAQNNNTVSLEIATASRIYHYTADIVIAADGSQSAVRDILKMPVKKIDYEQSALVTTTYLARESSDIAYERFQEQGAIAMLPLKGKQAATIWTAPHPAIQQLMALSDTEFLNQLQNHFGHRLGRLQCTGPRHVYPLYMQYTRTPRERNVLLIGNAAHTVHPIAAQGLNLALHEITILAEHLSSQAFLTGCLSRLPERFWQQDLSLYLSHTLIRLFESRLPGINAVRQWGLLGFDLCSIAKKHFAKYTIGRQSIN